MFDRFSLVEFLDDCVLRIFVLFLHLFEELIGFVDVEELFVDEAGPVILDDLYQYDLTFMIARLLD